MENRSSKKRGKILVADNSATIRRLIEGFLKDHCDVVEAATGAEIFSELEKYHGCDSHCIDEAKKGSGRELAPEITESCDLKDLSMVILSMEFPDYNAFQITKKIREKYHKNCLPLILSTSSNKRELIMEALKSGINDFIVKPFPKELLLAKIHRLEHEIPLHDRKLSELITKIPFFNGVPTSQVAYVINTLSETVTMEKGETVTTEGEENFDLFILLEGRCNVIVNSKKVAEILPVDTIGEMGFFEENKRSATVVAAENSKLIVIKKEPFDEFLNEERATSELICKNVIHSLNERIKKSNEMINKLKNLSEEYLKF